MRMILTVLAATAALGMPPALADGTTTTLQLDTVAANRDVHWVVAEMRGGQTVSSHPVYGITTYGNVAALSIPFTDNDGYWVARATLKLPPGATNPMLTIATLGVDDRAVVGLNHVMITGAGTYNGGEGMMTFKDPGPNVPYFFPYASGPENLVVTTGFHTGENKLQVIVNNTGNGIEGKLLPPGSNGTIGNSFGLTGTFTYTLPTP